jgi:hypothetical protein
MTGAPFVASLRTRPGEIQLGVAGEPTINIRVEMPEVWDAVRVETAVSEPVLGIKVRALEALYPGSDFHDAFVMKLNGWEIHDERESVVGVGAKNGSTFLLTFRRRRPVRD